MYTNADYLKAITSNLVSPAPREADIVMFHIGRSGSTVLGNLYNQNAQMFWDSEIFMTNRLPAMPDKAKNAVLNNPTRMVRARRLRTRRPFYGFEAKLSHVQRRWGSLEKCLAELQAAAFNRFIILRRRNHLRVVISDLASASAGGPWHVQKDPDKPRQVTVDVDAVMLGALSAQEPRPLIAHIAQAEAEFAHLERLLAGQSVLQLTYEDHIKADPRVAYRRTCEFLGIEPTAVAVKFRKTNPFSAAETITNYDEVAGVLEDSPYEWMLYE